MSGSTVQPLLTTSRHTAFVLMYDTTLEIKTKLNSYSFILKNVARVHNPDIKVNKRRKHRAYLHTSIEEIEIF